MTLAPGTRVGTYNILAAIGAGGMGEVYRAADSKLKRHVAIKILPAAFAADAERLSRFRREAEVLASLNHPGIAAIYGLEDTGGMNALVMELVEGPTLADRISHGAIPLQEALTIARQIAEAVEAAHAQGVVHRDLKPANIKVRDDGAVKVLDFGLAKAVGPEAANVPALADSPTITSPATHAGIILGTAAYMSPEQARGKPVDTRTDIWAFGCVLYEMLTGRRAFGGDETSDVLASILTRQPDFAALPSATPATIRRLLQRCLEKDRRDRLRDIGDARIEIRDALDQPPEETAANPPATSRLRFVERAAWLLLVVAFGATAVWLWRSRTSVAPPEMRVEINLPDGTVPFSLALSPDGRTIAFASTADGRSRLWLHSLESGTARPIRATDGANFPFWSPDSRHIGFFADGRLKRVDVESESVRIIANASTRGGSGSWSTNDEILFVSLGRPIHKVPAAGGEPSLVPGLEQQGSNFNLHFLPDGHRFLYYVRGTADVRGVYVGDASAPLGARRLVDADSGAVYLASGHLLFVRQGTLLAQRFDPVSLQVSGSPVPIAERATSTLNGAVVATSAVGSILYRRSGTRRRAQFAWFDRAGKQVATIGEHVPAGGSPSLSADGQHLAFYAASTGGANPDIFSVDLKRSIVSRVTTHVADDTAPIWSPDGRRIAFSSNRNGSNTIFQKLVGTATDETPLLASSDSKQASDWSRDGQFLLFNRQPAGFDVWALPLANLAKPFPVVQTEFDDLYARFSPDGRWIAYQSNESGREEIYLQPFPGPGPKTQISTAGGTQVRWRDDGRELLYIGLDERLMAVPVGVTAAAGLPDIGEPVALFQAPLGGAVQQADFRPQYAVSADGQRFLLAAVTPQSNEPATLILNWTPKRP